FVVTTPNMEYVPEYPIERGIIETYMDGRWGLREYSRWPQVLVPDLMHIPCIPRRPVRHAAPILFETISPTTSWTEDSLTGVRGLGFLSQRIRHELARAAGEAEAAFLRSAGARSDYRAHGHTLCTILGQAVIRMDRVAAPAGIAVAVAAHIQRIALELCGLWTYLNVVEPRLASGEDCSGDILHVLGAFVRDGTAAQSLVRVGIPTWYLQPLNPELEIWGVVTPRKMSEHFSKVPLDPPIYQRPETTAGILNITGNWLRTMTLTVSKLVCSTHMPPLAHACLPAVLPSDPRMLPAKRSKGNDGQVVAKHLQMRRAEPRTDRPIQPAKVFVQPAFYSLPEQWARALSESSPLPIGRASALYFWPPPFLLDTVQDNNVLQYLHNLFRIRRFCRARLFDPSMSSQPLSIVEWRAALWGEYNELSQDINHTSKDGVRRSKHRQEEWNAMCRLFGRVALLPSYRADMIVTIQDVDIKVKDITHNHCLRMLLLWEAHEINFRCELVALDTLLVQREDWSEIHRWEREKMVSAVWGPPSSIVSVLPPDGLFGAQDRWQSGTGWHQPGARDTLRFFLRVMTRWPDFPRPLVFDVENVDAWPSSKCSVVMQGAITFYVKTFVRIYERLPVPPIAPTWQSNVSDRNV
ncbi:hypothetical protein C8Q79DRAFT_921524, partial [Trametes meyenii]